MLESKKRQTRSMYRSVRYRINRQYDSKTAQPSSCAFRIKHNSFLESTIAKTTRQQLPQATMTIQLFPSQQLQKASYLQSFHSLMQRSGPVKLKRDHLSSIRSRKKMQQSAQKTNKKEVGFFSERVFIPDFEKMQKQVDISQHSLLTVFNTPFTHVKNIYIKASKQMQNQQNQMKQVKAGLRQIQKNINKQFYQINIYAESQFNIIRGILRKNQIQQQEIKLKTKRQIKFLEDNHNRNRNKFQQIANRSSNMQSGIFNSRPYDLKQHQQFGDQTFI